MQNYLNSSFINNASELITLNNILKELKMSKIIIKNA